MCTSGNVFIAVLVLSLCLMPISGFAPSTLARPSTLANGSSNQWHNKETTTTTTLFAGFGDGGGGKKQKSKEKKLKPKQQWDRFLDLKKETKYRVAVRADDTDEWLEVGNVKSKDNEYTAVALFRQRALVAEHARRLFPLKISQKDTVVWAFWNDESDEWVTVDKALMDDKEIPSSVEKLIGFEGRPDPSSGYYCVYNEGRLVNENDDSRPSSKKLK